MKLTDLRLEGLPEVSMNINDVSLDQMQIEVDPYAFVVEVVAAYHTSVLSNSSSKPDIAYDAVIEAVSEAIEIDIVEELKEEKRDLETEMERLQEQLDAANEVILEMEAEIHG